jgi:hypothetical protein
MRRWETGGFFMRFTIRDLLWATVVVAMGVALWITSQRAISREHAYKLWGFDIAARLLKDKTGAKMTANHDGVWIANPDGTVDQYRFGSEAVFPGD